MLEVPVILLLAVASLQLSGAEPYYGKKIGSLAKNFHEVEGEVYAVDSRTIHIRDFKYDGQGPDAFFYAGKSEKPNADGFIIPDEQGSKEVLKQYTGNHITLTLPSSKTLRDIRWISVWCRSFTVDFGSVMIPEDFDPPRPQKLEPMIGELHDVSADAIVVVDAQTFMVPNFTHDGQAPDAHFWVGRGKPDKAGIAVPDENGSDKPLGVYDKKTVVISLPGNVTIYDIDYLGVWCKVATVSFGHIRVPRGLNVPPSLRQLGQSPQSKLNCEVLQDDIGFEVRWAIAGETIVIQLVAQISEGDYISFGVSGDESRSQMIEGDVVVAWVDGKGVGHAVDYYLEDKAQCSGGRGSCPDYRIVPNTNSVRLLNYAVTNGYTMVTFQRALRAADSLDKSILKEGAQSTIWAVGPLNAREEVSYHRSRNSSPVLLEFGRSPRWNCPIPENEKLSTMSSTDAPEISTSSKRRGGGSRTTTTTTTQRPATQRSTRAPTAATVRPKTPPPPTRASAATGLNAWSIPPISCPEPRDNVFYAQIGPAGGKKGYQAITGRVRWGIGWYINGLLIPDITVVRGTTYTFFVEGGNDPESSARNHPLYITDDPEGGYGAKTAEEREKVRVFAGVGLDSTGEPFPTAGGRLCEWVQKVKESPETFDTFGQYQRQLELRCEKGTPGILKWTPDEDTPHEVYYQCYTHRYLGWKIRVVDSCTWDTDFAASILRPSNVTAPARLQQLHNRLRVNKPRASSTPRTEESQEEGGESEQQEIGYMEKEQNAGFGERLPAKGTIPESKPSVSRPRPSGPLTRNKIRPPLRVTPSTTTEKILVPESDEEVPFPGRPIQEAEPGNEEFGRGGPPIRDEILNQFPIQQIPNQSSQRRPDQFAQPPQNRVPNFGPQNGFPRPPQFPPGRNTVPGDVIPVQISSFNPDFESEEMPPEDELETQPVENPFPLNQSVPFQQPFQPGNPQYGGFNASSFTVAPPKDRPLNNKSPFPSAPVRPPPSIQKPLQVEPQQPARRPTFPSKDFEQRPSQSRPVQPLQQAVERPPPRRPNPAVQQQDSEERSPPNRGPPHQGFEDRPNQNRPGFDDRPNQNRPSSTDERPPPRRPSAPFQHNKPFQQDSEERPNQDQQFDGPPNQQQGFIHQFEGSNQNPQRFPQQFDEGNQGFQQQQFPQFPPQQNFPPGTRPQSFQQNFNPNFNPQQQLQSQSSSLNQQLAPFNHFNNQPNRRGPEFHSDFPSRPFAQNPQLPMQHENHVPSSHNRISNRIDTSPQHGGASAALPSDDPQQQTPTQEQRKPSGERPGTIHRPRLTSTTESEEPQPTRNSPPQTTRHTTKSMPTTSNRFSEASNIETSHALPLASSPATINLDHLISTSGSGFSSPPTASHDVGGNNTDYNILQNIWSIIKQENKQVDPKPEGIQPRLEDSRKRRQVPELTESMTSPVTGIEFTDVSTKRTQHSAASFPGVTSWVMTCAVVMVLLFQ